MRYALGLEAEGSPVNLLEPFAEWCARIITSWRNHVQNVRKDTWIKLFGSSKLNPSQVVDDELLARLRFLLGRFWEAASTQLETFITC